MPEKQVGERAASFCFASKKISHTSRRRLPTKFNLVSMGRREWQIGNLLHSL
jgi:hypothetical protein